MEFGLISMAKGTDKVLVLHVGPTQEEELMDTYKRKLESSKVQYRATLAMNCGMIHGKTGCDVYSRFKQFSCIHRLLC